MGDSDRSTNSMAVGAVDDDTDTLTKLRRSKQNYVDILLLCSQKPKISYEIDGRKFDWVEYQTFLRTQISGLSELINQMDPDEVITQGFT